MPNKTNSYWFLSNKKAQTLWCVKSFQGLFDWKRYEPLASQTCFKYFRTEALGGQWLLNPLKLWALHLSFWSSVLFFPKKDAFKSKSHDFIDLKPRLNAVAHGSFLLPEKSLRRRESSCADRLDGGETRTHLRILQRCPWPHSKEVLRRIWRVVEPVSH